MADLTKEDRDNYGRLKDAFSQLSVVDYKTDATLAKLAALINIDTISTDTDLLRQKIDSLDLYLKILEVRAITLDFMPTNKDEKTRLKQQLLDSFENLKRSLKVVEDEEIDLTDEIEEFKPEALFLEFIKKVELTNPPKFPNTSAEKPTEDLINDIDPNLSESQIEYLTNTWDAAISAFVEDARQEADTSGMVTPLEPTTFASFFRIHKELEILYSRLADSETVQLA